MTGHDVCVLYIRGRCSNNASVCTSVSSCTMCELKVV